MVWVHDYQLQLVPAMLRELRPDLRIGFFLHIPFPPAELFQQLPWRRQLLEGLLGADVVGFQRPGAAPELRPPGAPAGRPQDPPRHGLPARRPHRAGRLVPDLDRRRRASRSSRTASPCSSGPRRSASSSATPSGCCSAWTGSTTPRASTPGCARSASCWSEGELDVEDAVFVQVATPSRERVEQYRVLRDDIDRLVGRINGDLGRIGRPAISYLHTSYPREEMAALYRAADIMVVTPLRDGMNLVAKEYVACRYDGEGALVLSEFAGAADELRQAFLVNPYDINGMKASILEAISADPKSLNKRDAGDAQDHQRARRVRLGLELPRRALGDQAHAPQAAPPRPSYLSGPRVNTLRTRGISRARAADRLRGRWLSSRHGSDPQAGPGRLSSQQCRAQDVVRRAGRSPTDAPDPDRRRGAAGGLPLPSEQAGEGGGRPGPPGHAARRARALLRPAPRLLAGRAPGHRRPAHLPRGVRRGLLRQPRPRHGALGRRGDPGRGRGGQRARRRPAGARGRLEPRRDLRDAHRGGPTGPADRVAHRGRLPGRRHPGAARRADPPAAEHHRRRGPGHPALPAAGRGPEATGTPGVPAVELQQAGHQAARDRREARRHRLPRADRGRGPVHREHDRLPRPDVRAALPPDPQGQPARHRRGPDGRPRHRPRRHRGADAGLRRRQRRDRAGALDPAHRGPGDRGALGALRGGPRRPPRHAHRAGGTADHLADHRRVPRHPRHGARRARSQEGRREIRQGGQGHEDRHGHEAGQGRQDRQGRVGGADREEDAGEEGAREEAAAQKGREGRRAQQTSRSAATTPAGRTASARKAPVRRSGKQATLPNASSIGSNPTRRYGSASSRSLAARP